MSRPAATTPTEIRTGGRISSNDVMGVTALPVPSPVKTVERLWRGVRG